MLQVRSSSLQRTKWISLKRDPPVRKEVLEAFNGSVEIASEPVKHESN